MNYKKHYDKLILTRCRLTRKKSNNEYYEKHHIIPKSLGGSNTKENLVLLTFKEHYIAHLLLSKMYDGEAKRKMYYALWRMSSSKGDNKRILSASQYEICRLAGVLAKIKHPVTEETRKKISRGNKGKVRSEEMRNKNRLANLGKKYGPPSNEIREKISKGNKGKKRTEEDNQKNRERNLGRVHSEESKSKRSEKLIGRARPQEVIDKINKNNTQKKKIVCSNGVIYDGSNIAAKNLGLHQSNIYKVLYGQRKSTGGYTFKFLN